MLAIPSVFTEKTKTVAEITSYLASVTTNQMIIAVGKKPKRKDGM
jgi:hypothetical protein